MSYAGSVQRKTREAFLRDFEERIKGELNSIRKSYRNQQIRKLILFAIGIVSVFTAMRFLLPPLMILFFFVGFGLYFLLFRKRTKRIEVDERMRRMFLKRVVEISSYPFSLNTHQFIPQFQFEDSNLFDFKPDRYSGEEMIELGASRELAISLIEAEEKTDMMDEKTPGKFEGLFLRLKNVDQASRSSWDLSAKEPFKGWSSRINDDTFYAAGPFPRPYKVSFLDVKLNRDAAWKLYALISWLLNP